MSPSSSKAVITVTIPELQAFLSRLVAESSASALETLQGALLSGEVTVQSSVNEVLHRLRPYSISPLMLTQLFQIWSRTSLDFCTPTTIALALGTAIQVRRQVISEVPQLELVWTGPYPPNGGTARPTASILQEMLVSAHKRILLVGYNLTAGSEFSVGVVQALAAAHARGCEVTIALHDDGINHDKLEQLWPGALSRPRLLYWAERKVDSMSSLHAKLLTVDGMDLLVTSANLTYHGLESNMEVGVRIRNSDLAWQVTRHFAALEQEGILIPYKG